MCEVLHQSYPDFNSANALLIEPIDRTHGLLKYTSCITANTTVQSLKNGEDVIFLKLSQIHTYLKKKTTTTSMLLSTIIWMLNGCICHLKSQSPLVHCNDIVVMVDSFSDKEEHFVLCPRFHGKPILCNRTGVPNQSIADRSQVDRKGCKGWGGFVCLCACY